jgi:competence protein ComEA
MSGKSRDRLAPAGPVGNESAILLAGSGFMLSEPAVSALALSFFAACFFAASLFVASLFAASLFATQVFAADEMPDGPGKAIIAQHCSGCHQGAALSRYQKTREEWDTIVTRMGQRTEASREELNTLADYLAANFPKVDDPNKVNMNKAAAKEMVERLGLSEKEATAIVEYRERRGSFRAWGDLLVIYGVDGSKIEAAQDKMSF